MTDSFVPVISRETIDRRVQELATQIRSDVAGDDAIVVAVLMGSLIFMKDLMSHLPYTYTADFLSLTRFGRDGRVSVAMDVSVPLEGQDVILVLEIVDTGLTLATIRKMMLTRGVRSLRTVALIDKAPRRIVDVPVEYRGFEVGDEYLLGYGMDWEGKYRNLDSIWAVLDLGVLADEPERFESIAFGALA
ncbi:MAG: hypoxanthine phosphoribosyltransferase [Proteobacteria bacterium]|nr:hypoxanthine phosphoribosyltransferase [Pseudomonadota bacterium]